MFGICFPKWFKLSPESLFARYLEKSTFHKQGKDKSQPNPWWNSHRLGHRLENWPSQRAVSQEVISSHTWPYWSCVPSAPVAEPAIPFISLWYCWWYLTCLKGKDKPSELSLLRHRGQSVKLNGLCDVLVMLGWFRERCWDVKVPAIIKSIENYEEKLLLGSMVHAK